MELHFAPLQGYADHFYRKLHAAIYGGIDVYYTPFIRVEKGSPRHQDIARLKASTDESDTLIPQIIFNSVNEFRVLTDALKGLGWNRIDLNLGCPYPMQTKRGRGAAMMADILTMKEVSALINADTSTEYSVKMRLGIKDPDEWRRLLPILNDTKLAHVSLHARVARQMYSGEPDTDAFQAFLEASQPPVVYNGGLSSIDEIAAIRDRFPGLKGVMIGRGLLGRPSLSAEWQEGREWRTDERLTHLGEFHDALLHEYEATLCGPTQILQKIKPFWDYLEPEIGHKGVKAVHKAGSMNRYLQAVSEAFSGNSR